METPIFTSGLNQCSAVIIVNSETGKVLATHSSVGHFQPIMRNIDKIGPRNKNKAFIVSGDWGNKNIARYLKSELKMPSQEVSIENALSHINIAYDPQKRSFIIYYKNKKEQTVLGEWDL